MKNQREQRRLIELFSGIEVLVGNPAGKIPETHAEPESLPSQVADLEQSLLGDENGELETKADLLADAQVEQQAADGVLLHENNQMASADTGHKSEALHDFASPLTEIFTSKPPPVKSEVQTTGELENTPPPSGQLPGDESSLASWQAAGIGAITGVLVAGIILVSSSQFGIFNHLGRIALVGWEVLCGIIGALVAKTSKKSGWGIWFGAIEWSLVPIGVVLSIILLIYAVAFSYFFGS